MALLKKNRMAELQSHLRELDGIEKRMRARLLHCEEMSNEAKYTLKGLIPTITGIEACRDEYNGKAGDLVVLKDWVARDNRIIREAEKITSQGPRVLTTIKEKRAKFKEELFQLQQKENQQLHLPLQQKVNNFLQGTTSHLKGSLAEVAKKLNPTKDQVFDFTEDQNRNEEGNCTCNLVFPLQQKMDNFWRGTLDHFKSNPSKGSLTEVAKKLNPTEGQVFDFTGDQKPEEEGKCTCKLM